MTSWFRRQQESLAPPGPDPHDTPEALLGVMFDRVHDVNQNAGKLPIEAVIVARRVLDAVREVVETSGERELDIHAVVAVRGILEDYLPTSLRAYLALDPATAAANGPGPTPTKSLIEQLETLWESATDLLAATRSQDANALLSQGSFLRTKFSRSDLDL
jgi:hypothetical protein